MTSDLLLGSSGITLGRRQTGLQFFRRGGLTVAQLNALEPYAESHRIGGADLGPDSTIESGVQAAAWGQKAFDGGDLWKGTDGQPLVMHDSTVDRTTTATGNVTSFSEATLTALNIDAGSWFSPVWSNTLHPPTFAALLAFISSAGGVAFPEIKTTGDATFNATVLAAIQAAGMTARTVIGSTSIGDLAVFKAAGIATVFIAGGVTPTPASLVAGGVDIFSFDNTQAGYTQSYLATISAVGIRLQAWTIDRRSDWVTAQAKGATSLVSNEPLYVLGGNTLRTSDNFAAQTWDHGMIPSGAVRGVWRGGVKFGIDGGMAVLMGSMSKAAPWTSITAKFTYEAIPDATRFAVLGFGCVDDANYSNHSSFGNAYEAFYRPDGRLQLFKRTGATSTQMGSTVTLPTLSAGQACTLKCEPPQVGSSVVKLTHVESGQSITVTDSSVNSVGPYRGGYWHYGNNNNGTGTIQTSMSNVVLVP